MKNNVENVIYSKYLIEQESWRIVQIDEQFTAMLGYTMEDIKEHQYTLLDLIPSEDLTDYQKAVMLQHQKGPCAYLWHRMRCKDGRYIYVFCYGESVQGTDSDIPMSSILITDTTSIISLQNEVMEKNEMITKIFDNVPVGTIVFDVRDIDGIRKLQCLYYNRSMQQEYEFDFMCGNLIPLDAFYEYYFMKEDLENAKLVETLRDKDKCTFEARIRCKSGAINWTLINVFPIVHRENSTFYMALIIDVSKRKEEELSTQFQNELIKLCVEDERFFDQDLEKDTYTLSEMVNGELREIVHYEEYIKRGYNSKWVHPDDAQYVREEYKRITQKADRFDIEFRSIGEHGNDVWISTTGVSLAGADGKVYRIVGKDKDITEEKLRQRELMQQAERDALTGIYNHVSLLKYVNANIGRQLEGNCAFMILDIDDFKMVNDAWGHESGDNLLSKVGRMLRTYVQGIGLAGRSGGDVFDVFLYQVSDEAELLGHMSNLCNEMMRLSDRMQLTVSIGASFSKRENANVTRLYKEADQALYAAKRGGGNNAIIFDKEIIEAERRKISDGGLYIEEEDLILSEASEGVYVMDLETYETLYINDSLYEAIKRSKGDFDWENKPCYQVLYDRYYPCEFCNIHQLKKHESMYWQRRNELNNRQYVCKDSLINWQGRRARMEVVYDVTTPTDMLHALEKSLGSIDTLKQCISNVTDSGAFHNSFRKLLRFVGKYYAAEASRILEENEEGLLWAYDWKSEKSSVARTEETDEQDRVVYEAIQQSANKQGIAIFDKIMQYEQENSALFEVFKRHKIWTIYAILLKKNDVPIGCLVVINPKQHLGDMLLLSTLSAFLSNEIVRKQIWEKQEYELTHDPQTGAYNRSCYMNKIASLNSAQSVGLAVVDVNNMKQVNNDFGSDYGNRMVLEVAEILMECFGKENIYRFHSDDFCVLCQNEERDTFASYVEKARMMLQNHEVGACIGYVWDDFDMDIRKMTEHAEELLKIEKQKFHESTADNPRYRKSEIIANIKAKMAEGYFKVFLQPKICMPDASIYGAEALIRAVDPEMGILSPATFIPVYEKTGTIEYIDFFVFEEVCKLIKKWEMNGTHIVPISFNFSRLTLLSPSLIDRVETIVKKYDVSKKYLEIEITETIGDMEYDMIARIASSLRRAGYRLSMDDFGTKYSSISTLSIMKFDILKIDRSMVNTLADNEISRKIMNHVIAMCQDLGIECIAEGVETEEQAKLLQTMDCMIAQGYLYGKPMPIEEFSQKYLTSLQNA